MGVIKTNKKISTLILWNLFTIVSLLTVACGENSTKKVQMENKNLLSSARPESNQKGNTATTDTITLGGGCFWCVEAVYQMLEGVIKVESGFSGGTVKNPSYREVCTGLTGHAEVAQITFDSSKTSVDEILKVFFTVHDPTSLNRQGDDEGTQYRSVIFYRNQHQQNIAKSIINALNTSHAYDKPIVTQLVSFRDFYIAEDYHQDYYNQHKDAPYCKLVIQPKLEKFEKVFKDRLKK